MRFAPAWAAGGGPRIKMAEVAEMADCAEQIQKLDARAGRVYEPKVRDGRPHLLGMLL